MQTLGAIDIGSNAIRLLIMNVENFPHEPVFKKAAFIRVPIRLGEDVFVHGRVGEKKALRLEEAIAGFGHLMKAFGVQRYLAYATSAMREARNGQEVTDEIFRRTGARIKIVHGRREAETAFACGAADLFGPDKTYLYVDVGGGSTEIIVYADSRIVEARSFTLGTVRTLNRGMDEEEVKRMKKWLKGVAVRHTPSVIIGSGGNINRVQKLLNKKEKENISYTELKVLYDYVRSYSYEDRIHVLKLNTYRADVIVPAMRIFLAVCKAAKIDQIAVPKLGLADGIIHELHSNLRTGQGEQGETLG